MRSHNIHFTSFIAGKFEGKIFDSCAKKRNLSRNELVLLKRKKTVFRPVLCIKKTELFAFMAR